MDSAASLCLRFIPLLMLILPQGSSATDQSGDETPRMLSTPSNINVIEGDNVLLPCHVLHLNKRVRIWKRLPSKIIFSGTVSVSKDERIVLINGTSLQINDITPRYAGEYVCQISHHPLLNVSHRIQVLVPPSILSDPLHGRVIARKGTSTTIVCSATGIPTPVVTWTYERDGAQQSSLPSGVHQVNGEQLQVASVDVDHAGMYSCTADNDVGDPVSVNFNFTVLYAPEVTIKPDWVHGDEGASVEFLCASKAAPLAQITWLKGDPKQGLPLEEDDRVRVSEKISHPTGTESWLRIQRLRKTDIGSYTCIAKNSVGQTWRMVEISGLAEPLLLRGSESGENSFLLRWTTKSYSPIREYQLKIRRHKSGDAWTDVVIPVSEDGMQQSLLFSQSYNVTGLESGVRYEAVLQAHNNFGWNRPSETLLFSAGAPPTTESIAETTTMTVLPLYDAELDITDPTYLKQDSPANTFSPFVLLYIVTVLTCFV